MADYTPNYIFLLCQSVDIDTTGMTTAQMASAYNTYLIDSAASQANAVTIPVANTFLHSPSTNITDWTGFDQTHTLANGITTMTASATNGNMNTSMGTLVAGHQYYVKAAVRVTGANAVYVYVPGYTAQSVWHSGSGLYEDLSFIITVTTSAGFRVRDARTSNWTPVDVTNMIAIDLTATFSVGNEPTKAQMDAYLLSNFPTNSWFQGSTSISIPGTSDTGQAILSLNTRADRLQLPDKTLVCLGDSITNNGDYPAQVGLITDMTVVQAGFNSCCMTKTGTEPLYTFSMAYIADAIASGVWTTQVENQTLLDAFDFTGQVSRLSAVDWTKVDYMTINYCTNDWYKHVTIGATSSTDVTEFCGAMNHAITVIQTAHPQIKIYFISPMWRFANVTGDCDTTANASGLYLHEFVDAMKDVAEYRHLPFLDLFRKSGVNAITQSIYLLANDGVHPQQAGYDLMAQKIARFLLSGGV